MDDDYDNNDRVAKSMRIFSNNNLREKYSSL